MLFIRGQQRKNQKIKVFFCFYFYNSASEPELVTRCHSNTPNNFFEIKQFSTINATYLPLEFPFKAKWLLYCNLYSLQLAANSVFQCSGEKKIYKIVGAE